LQTPHGRLTLLLFHDELGEPTGPTARRLRGAGHPFLLDGRPLNLIRVMPAKESETR
jgi:hypothetical protein